MRMRSIVLNSVLAATAAFTISGCSAMAEMGASAVEVPTLENQANRVAVGMAIVRENNMMAKADISADAKWPALVTEEVTPAQKQFIIELVMDDPYYSTMQYSKAIQRKMLGSGFIMDQLSGAAGVDLGAVAALADQAVSPLALKAFKKITVFYANPDLKPKEAYGSDTRYYEAARKNFPDIFDFNSDLSTFLEFTNGKQIDIEAPSGDVYSGLGAAVIALAPVNLQKDLEASRDELLVAYEEVLSLKGQEGELKNTIESKDSSEADKAQAKTELDTVETQVKQAESYADEKEAVYFNLLDQATLALDGAMELDNPAYVGLAKNVNLVSAEIQSGATEAYTAFGIAATKLVVDGIIQNFPKELKSLGLAKANVPANLQSRYDERVARLGKNALMLLPNAVMGTYYAYKQSVLAEKYEEFSGLIVEAHLTKLEAETEAAAAEEAPAEEPAAE